MTFGIFYHPDFLKHKNGPDHPESPQRLQVIRETIRDLESHFQYLEPREAQREDLLRVHDAHYIDNLFWNVPQTGYYRFDPDTAMNPYTLSAALRASGAACEGVDWIMNEKLKRVFCCVRPPGHHAERDRAMGFCFLNHIAIAVMYAHHHYQLTKMAVVDFDVHHGNGTEQCFEHDSNVLLCSTFQSPLFPMTGRAVQTDHILNFPLNAGGNGEDFREVAAIYLKRLRDFQPEMIFISAGFDAHYADPLANLNWDESDYAWITSELVKVANETCHGRIISLLEGGYNLTHLGACVRAHLEVLIK